jgi:hypothetical protein
MDPIRSIVPLCGDPQRTTAPRCGRRQRVARLSVRPWKRQGSRASTACQGERFGSPDKNFVGLPQEGYGASNDVRPAFAAPGFEESSFAVKAGTVTRMSIRMGY